METTAVDFQYGVDSISIHSPRMRTAPEAIDIAIPRIAKGFLLCCEKALQHRQQILAPAMVNDVTRTFISNLLKFPASTMMIESRALIARNTIKQYRKAFLNLSMVISFVLAIL
jgi:hypothetical protein